MEKRFSLGGGRRKLSDITNVFPQPISLIHLEKPSAADASSDKLKVDHLLKENLTLVKLLEQKNQIIESTELEIRKLRVNLQKLQLQNLNLAQSNSHMLAELNLGKDKLKLLRHESMCKEALLKAKSMDVKEQERKKIQSIKDGDDAIMEECTANEGEKGSRGECGRPIRTRSTAMGNSSSSADEQVVETTKIADNTRRRVRRKSAVSSKIEQQQEGSDETKKLLLSSVTESDMKKRRKSVVASCSKIEQQQEASDETKKLLLSSVTESDTKKRRKSVVASSKIEASEELQETKKLSSSSSSSSSSDVLTELPSFAKDEEKNSVGGLRRSSLGGRPSRIAAGKVQSYKEIPLNVKMRKPE